MARKRMKTESEIRQQAERVYKMANGKGSTGVSFKRYALAVSRLFARVKAQRARQPFRAVFQTNDYLIG